jgi:hypothetical protein
MAAVIGQDDIVDINPIWAARNPTSNIVTSGNTLKHP